jgi:hypothetical protein
MRKKQTDFVECTVAQKKIVKVRNKIICQMFLGQAYQCHCDIDTKNLSA